MRGGGGAGDERVNYLDGCYSGDITWNNGATICSETGLFNYLCASFSVKDWLEVEAGGVIQIVRIVHAMELTLAMKKSRTGR